MPFQVSFVLNSLSSISHKLSPSSSSFNPVKKSGAVDPSVLLFNRPTLKYFLHMIHQLAKCVCGDKFQAWDWEFSWSYP